MSSYKGVWRTNEFDVKDLPAFEQWVKRWPDASYTVLRNGRVQLAKEYHSEWGGIPIQQYSAQEGWVESLDFLPELQRHVMEGCVCVLRVVGSEELKYLDGHTHAVRGGEGEPELNIISLDLEDIEKMAKKTFALPVTPF